MSKKSEDVTVDQAVKVIVVDNVGAFETHQTIFTIKKLALIWSFAVRFP